MNKEEAVKEFLSVFGGEGREIITVFSPGRINLIGEHIDYNGGRVFPAALTIGTYLSAALRDDQKVRFFSGNFKEKGIYEWDLPISGPDKRKGFSNYLAGMIETYEKVLGLSVHKGFDLYLWGNIPNSSGLSSSASVETGMGKILNELYGFSVSNFEIAKLGQYSENHFNGVNCGIMDQFAITMGKKDSAIYLDTATLQYDYVPIQLEGMKIVISCTNKKRGLADSKYNERRRECENALAKIQTVKPVRSLCDLTPEEFETVRRVIKNPIEEKRARHAIYENARTKEAVRKLEAGDLTGFGELMKESHISLRDDYEVTGIELDTLFEASVKVKGCIGARMTGAGFGGCAIALVKEDSVSRYCEEVGKYYENSIGYPASFYTVEVGDGTYRM